MNRKSSITSQFLVSFNLNKILRSFPSRINPWSSHFAGFPYWLFFSRSKYPYVTKMISFLCIKMPCCEQELWYDAWSFTGIKLQQRTFTFTFLADLYFLFKRFPTSLKSGVAFQHVCISQLPDIPWHLHFLLTFLITALKEN